MTEREVVSVRFPWREFQRIDGRWRLTKIDGVPVDPAQGNPLANGECKGADLRAAPNFGGGHDLQKPTPTREDP